jgi:hypothetical protein
MTSTVFRIHPAIGFARVGDSQDYYLAPESMAGFPDPNHPTLAGGLPVQPGTENTPIKASDLRDGQGRLKRQAARFRIFAYDGEAAGTYPSGQGREIQIGSKVGERVVEEIVWTVHVANKKGNCFVLDVPGYDGSIIERYRDGRTPPLRNVKSEQNQTQLTIEVPNINAPGRVMAWTTDPGPRSIRGTGTGAVAFDRETPASADLTPIPGYLKLFPAGDERQVYAPRGVIDTLGHLETDARGRLIVVGGYGRACALRDPLTGKPAPLGSDVDNDGWYDDTSDGPVTATLHFRDGGRAEVAGAWVAVADPAYAPQILNAVSLWDEVYDTFVRALDLQPELYRPAAGYNPAYRPAFETEIAPVFAGAGHQEWIANLPAGAREAHRAVSQIKATDRPETTILAGLAYIRDPNLQTQSDLGPPMMPLALGDSGKAFLSPTYTQYFFLSQWAAGRCEAASPKPLGPGEALDKASLIACLGGRFSPGIDLTFTVRQPDVYVQDWRASGQGPFRIAGRPLDYGKVRPGEPFLTGGYVPMNTGNRTVEPGDMTKFMSVPWHTDYNSCATHPTSPSIRNITTLYWSWPAQRPVNVYVAAENQAGQLGPQRYSVRGTGTGSPDLANQGRYQDRADIISHWPKIGTVLQGAVIDTVAVQNPDRFLEAQGLLTGKPDPEVEPWPMNQSATPSA